MQGKEAKVEVTSDGTRLRRSTSSKEPPKQEVLKEEKDEPTPADFHKAVSAQISRAGLMALDLENLRGVDVDKSFPIAMFKLEAAEKIRGRDAKVVSYGVGAGTAAARVTLWLDAKTLLPLKRVSIRKLDFGTEKVEMRLVETYNEFTLDPKVEAKTFELPK